MSIQKNFAKKLKEIRLKKWISQEALASKAWVHRTYIWMIERCEKNPTLISLEKLAKALDVKVVDLLDFSDKKYL